MNSQEPKQQAIDERLQSIRFQIPPGLTCLLALPDSEKGDTVHLCQDRDLRRSSPPGRIIAALLVRPPCGWWLVALRPGRRARREESEVAQRLGQIAALVGLRLRGVFLFTGRRRWTLWTKSTVEQLETTLAYRQGVPMGHRRRPDHFTKRAQREGYAARSVYKLDEIDRKRRIFSTGQVVLDLGCAPGSWVKFIARKVGSKGTVVGIDRKEIDLNIPQVTTIAGDIFETDAQVFLDLSKSLYDVVTSDMAPDTCGDRWTDHVRSVGLCERALHLSYKLLKPGGTFICKVFEGSDLPAFIQVLRTDFEKVTRIKPKSTRSESVELFLVAEKLKPRETSEVHTS